MNAFIGTTVLMSALIIEHMMMDQQRRGRKESTI
jgi:hypothetical protein